MRHPTYKHLEGRLRLGTFSLGQWAQIATAGTAAAVFGVYVSPLPTDVTIFVSILVAGLPVALSYGAMGLEFSIGQFAQAAWRYWREPRRYLPGPGASATGYVAHAADQAPAAPHAPEPQQGPGDVLWDV
jgi:hypothetical protein